MSNDYPQWEPPPFDPGDDALSAHVGEQEDRDVIRDPLADAPAKVVHVSNHPPQPRPAVLERTPHDPNAGYVDRVELRSHLERQPESTDRFAGQSQAIVAPIGEEPRR